MNRDHWGTAFSSQVMFCFIAVLILPASGCDAGPPPAVAPEVPVEVNDEHFSNAKLTIKDAAVKDRKFILEKGKEYEYSGSFQLAQMDDEVPGYKRNVSLIRAMLLMKFIVDGDKSGFERGSSNPQTKEVGEVTVATVDIHDSWFESPNIIHFKGKLKAHKYVGESELRLLTFFPDQPKQIQYIITRTVEVVDPKAQTGGEK